MDSFLPTSPASCFDTVYSLKIGLLNAIRGQGSPPPPAKPLLSSMTMDPLAPNSTTFPLSSTLVSPPFCHPELGVSPAPIRSSRYHLFSVETLGTGSREFYPSILILTRHNSINQHVQGGKLSQPSSSLPQTSIVTQALLQPHTVIHRH